MGKRAQIKLKRQSGETIAEVLIALLVCSLALVMLAGMISATQRMIAKSKIKMQEYYQANDVLEKMTEENDDSQGDGDAGGEVNSENETNSSPITVLISNANNVSISVPNDGFPDMQVTCFSNNVLGKTVYSYGLMPAASSDDDSHDGE